MSKSLSIEVFGSQKVSLVLSNRLVCRTSFETQPINYGLTWYHAINDLLHFAYDF